MAPFLRHRRQALFILSVSATFGLTSNMRPGTYGPRSSTVTVADFPLSRLITLPVVPGGNILLAATFVLNRRPPAK
jgi:hypothetical protein